MAESSTCLVRSFSTPSETSCVTHEGNPNPLRALSESISFGRYMSESLDWAKWSAFTCNRYVEEAEKYSKPGSVAAKKAYFEAHYKRKAAEKSAALVEEANVKANRNFDSEILEQNGTGSSAQMKSESDNIEMASEEINKDIVDNHVVDCGDDTNQCKFGDEQNDFEIKSEADSIEIINEEMNKDTFDNQVVDSDDQCKCDVGENDFEVKSEADNIEIINEEVNQDIVNFQVVDCDDTNQCKCDDTENDLDISEMEGAEKVLHPCNDMNLDVESCTLVDNSNKLDHVEVDENIAIPVEEKVPPYPDITGQEVLALPVKGREENSSPKSPAGTRVNKLPHSRDVRKTSSALPPRIGITSSSKRENTIVDAFEKKRVTLRSLRTSINLPSSTGETSKIADAVLRPRNGMNRISTSKNAVGSLVEKKRSTASSLHMSINLPSGIGIASKLAAVMPKPRNGINIVPKSPSKTTARSLHMSINLSSGTDEKSKTTSVFEHNRYTKIHCDLPKVHSVTSPKSTKASHGLLNQAPGNLPSQGRRTERPLNKSVSGDVIVNANSCLKSSSTAKIIPRPPTITSAFRFRSEERAIKRKELLQSKTENVHKNLPQSSGSKSKLNDDGPSGPQSPKNQIRKISVTLPRSPRQVRQASSSCSSSTTKSVGNSWKPPISANNSKRITEKDNRIRQSVTSLSNTTWENASPNIQL